MHVLKLTSTGSGHRHQLAAILCQMSLHTVSLEHGFLFTGLAPAIATGLVEVTIDIGYDGDWEATVTGVFLRTTCRWCDGQEVLVGTDSCKACLELLTLVRDHLGVVKKMVGVT